MNPHRSKEIDEIEYGDDEYPMLKLEIALEEWKTNLPQELSVLAFPPTRLNLPCAISLHVSFLQVFVLFFRLLNVSESMDVYVEPREPDEIQIKMNDLLCTAVAHLQRAMAIGIVRYLPPFLYVKSEDPFDRPHG